MADLPALRPDELARALTQVFGAPTAFVSDAQGIGTTMFAARSHDKFWPQFGDRSRARHIEAGAEELLSPEPCGLRQDVDNLEDLERARALGLGFHTDAVRAAVMPSDSEASGVHQRRVRRPR
jgi:2-phospho-L-lactate guanylyltransferase